MARQRIRGVAGGALALVVAAMGLAIVPILTAPASAASSHPTEYYLNLGDSYAEGYQPGYPDNSETLHGYADRVDSALWDSHPMTLENFGCGGATTTSILDDTGCSADDSPMDGVSYPTTTQAQAALNFINVNKGHIGLITISIGGNDFDRCITSQDPVGCVSAALPQMKANITTLATELRAAAGPSVPMIGLTYPNIALGAWVISAADHALASESVIGFSALINPAIKGGYTPAKVHFVDITTDAGGDIPLTTTTTLAPYGTIPVAVADVCRLTWMCSQENIHPKNAGYALIASEIVKAYDKMAS